MLSFPILNHVHHSCSNIHFIIISHILFFPPLLVAVAVDQAVLYLSVQYVTTVCTMFLKGLLKAIISVGHTEWSPVSTDCLLVKDNPKTLCSNVKEAGQMCGWAEMFCCCQLAAAEHFCPPTFSGLTFRSLDHHVSNNHVLANCLLALATIKTFVEAIFLSGNC